MKLISVLIFHTYTLTQTALVWVSVDSGDDTRPVRWTRLQEHVWLTKALLFSAWVESQTSLLESLHWGLKMSQILKCRPMSSDTQLPTFPPMLALLFPPSYFWIWLLIAFEYSASLFSWVFLPLPCWLSLFPSNCQGNSTKLLKRLRKWQIKPSFLFLPIGTSEANSSCDYLLLLPEWSLSTMRNSLQLISNQQNQRQNLEHFYEMCTIQHLYVVYMKIDLDY